MPDQENPYAPPRASDYGLPPAAPPVDATPTAVPKVFGVLSIVFASIMTLGGFLGSCSLFAVGFADAIPKNGNQDFMEMQPFISAMKQVYGGIGIDSVIILGMSIWLLVLGVGQLRYRQWACKQSVVWGLAGLISVGVFVLIALTMIGPGYKQMFEAMAHGLPKAMGHGTTPPVNMPTSMGTFFGGSMSVTQIILLAPYPILLVAFFSRENVRASMSS